MAELNDKQREWCRLVAAGVSRSDAYRKAFNRSEMSNDAARKAAHRLSQRDDVCHYLDKLRAEADAAAVLTREERMRMLSRSAVRCENGERYGEMAKMIAELNKMDGAYEPERVEVSGVLGVGAVVAALQEGGQKPPVH